MPLDIGIEIVRPYAEARVFQHGEIAIPSRFSFRRRQGGMKQHRAVAVALILAAPATDAALPLGRRAALTLTNAIPTRRAVSPPARPPSSIRSVIMR
jgi:hypothetical protein